MEFLSFISQHLCKSLLSEIKLNHVYSILIDKSIERKCEPHLIDYICYLEETSQSTPCFKFIELMLLSRRTGEVMFNSIQELLKRCGLDLMKFVAIATNGALCMT
jgi:hypothetical protein